MQKLLLSLIIAAFFAACASKNNSASSVKEYNVHVWGNCEKCKATIEKSCQIMGVKDADWSVESKLLSIKVDTTKSSIDAVLEEVSKAGYDNETYFADDYAYGALPQCCQYERRPTE